MAVDGATAFNAAVAEAQVAALTDRAAITDVVTRYAIAIDSADWDGLASCFAAEAVLHFPNRELVGPAAIVAYIQTATTGRSWQQHLIGSIAVRLEGDAATARCGLQALQVMGSAPGEALLTAGTYHDRLARRDGEWRIVNRRLDVGWTGTLHR